MESGFSRNRIFSELARSPHKSFEDFVEVGGWAAEHDPEFLAKLIAWNKERGTIRDANVALPVITMSRPSDSAFLENARAHLAMLPPRDLVRAVRFSRKIKVPGHGRNLRRLVERYLRSLEANEPRFDRVVLSQRSALRELYSFRYPGGGILPSERANIILNKKRILVAGTPRGEERKKFREVVVERPEGALRKLNELRSMTPLEAAGTILEYKIPTLAIFGAVGKRVKEPEILLAMIEGMTPAQLTNYLPFLEKAGAKGYPAVEASLKKVLERIASRAPTTNLMRLSRKAEALSDPGLRAAVTAAQGAAIAGSVQGDWLVICDISGSMEVAIEYARQLSAYLTAAAGGLVHLIFTNTGVSYHNVTGKSHEEISSITRSIKANGGTNLSGPLSYLMDPLVQVDGIAVVSDGGENTGSSFSSVYRQYSQLVGKNIPIYLYRVPGDPNNFAIHCGRDQVDFTQFDVSPGKDKATFYAIPTLACTMRTNRFSLVDEVMAMPLRTVDQVLGAMAQHA